MAETFSLVQRHKGRGIKTWYIRTCINGQDSYKSTGTSVKTEAMKIFAEFVKGRDIQGSRIDVNEIDVIDEIGNWMEIQSAKFGTDSNTFRMYRANSRLLKDYLERKRIRLFVKVDRNVAQGFSNEMMKAGKKASTIEITLRCVKAFFNWIIDNYELTARNPFNGVARPKVENRLVEFWTTDECDKIIDNIKGTYWKAFFGLQCYAGLRTFEARKLRIEDVKFGFIMVLQDKTKKDSMIPINDKLKKLLDDAIGIRTEGSIFDGYIGRNHMTAGKVLKRAVSDAGLLDRGRVFPHRLRHSFASNLLREGVNIKAVEKLGRWSNSKILLKHYAGVIDEDLINAVSKI